VGSPLERCNFDGLVKEKREKNKKKGEKKGGGGNSSGNEGRTRLLRKGVEKKITSGGRTNRKGGGPQKAGEKGAKRGRQGKGRVGTAGFLKFVGGGFTRGGGAGGVPVKGGFRTYHRCKNLSRGKKPLGGRV